MSFHPQLPTHNALLEQLVYVDGFMKQEEPQMGFDDHRLSLELAAFADDLFVFHDEEKPREGASGGVPEPGSSGSSGSAGSSGASALPEMASQNTLLAMLPKVAVPPGANSLLSAAGLNQTQIDALAALVAQHQQDAPVKQLAPPVETPVESDKRRRNTQALARFRHKKKMKEQQLEASVKQLGEQARELEAKVQQLEMENDLLRNLITDRNSRRDEEVVEGMRERARRGTEV